jgi:hypothetical protein
MERRKLLQGMLALPVATALGCRHKDNTQPRRSNTKLGTLKVYLHGPFAVVLNTKNQFRIKAFVPFDDDGKHEFRYPNPQKLVSESDADHRKRFEFILRDDHLELSGKRPRIDAGFGDFQIHTGEWEPRPTEYFVSLDLPAPEVITFVPRATVPVAFVSGKLGMMPLDHILEYRVRNSENIGKIRLHSPQLKSDDPPITCQDMLSMHSEAMKAARAKGPKDMPMPHLEAEFKQCAESSEAAFFLGVGLSPDGFSIPAAKMHALNFFNNSLLPSFPNAPEREREKLQAVDVVPCATAGGASASPTLTPAAYQYPGPAPYFRQVASFDDCRAGGLIGLMP